MDTTHYTYLHIHTVSAHLQLHDFLKMFLGFLRSSCSASVQRRVLCSAGKMCISSCKGSCCRKKRSHQSHEKVKRNEKKGFGFQFNLLPATEPAQRMPFKSSVVLFSVTCVHLDPHANKNERQVYYTMPCRVATVWHWHPLASVNIHII